MRARYAAAPRTETRRARARGESRAGSFGPGQAPSSRAIDAPGGRMLLLAPAELAPGSFSSSLEGLKGFKRSLENEISPETRSLKQASPAEGLTRGPSGSAPS